MSYCLKAVWIGVLTTLIIASASRGQPAAPAEQPPAASPAPPDPALIFSSDTMVYAEIVRPGHQAERFLKLLADGGIEDPMQMLMRRMQPASSTGAIATTQTAISAPLAMILNPSLINELKKIDGIAVGLLGFNVETAGRSRRQEPAFLAALYPGRSDAIRGLVQMLVAMGSKSVEQHGTIAVNKLGDGSEAATPYAAVTQQAIIVGMPKKMVTDALDRLKKPHADCLGTNKRFQAAVAEGRTESALLVYADVDRLLREITAKMTVRERNDFAKVQQLLGLDAIDEACWRYGFTNDGLVGEGAVSLKTGQACAIYNLLRTPPADRSLLTFVPADAMGFLACSLGDGGDRYDRILSFVGMAASLDRPRNAATRPAPEEAIAKAEAELGVSIRNDLAANVESVALAMLPLDTKKLSGSGDAIKMAMASSLLLVAKVKDPASFDQTLGKLADTLARKLTEGIDARAVATEEPVDGGVIRVYAIPGCPVVPVAARLDRTYLFAVDRTIVQAALAAHTGTKPNVAGSGPCWKALASIPANASKIFALRPDVIAGFVLRVAVPAGRRTSDAVGAPPAFPEIPVMQPVTVYTVENENRLTVRGDIRDVPKMIAAAVQLHAAGVMRSVSGPSSPSVSPAARLASLGRASGESVREAVSVAASTNIDDCRSPLDLLVCGEYLLLGGNKERAVASIAKAIERGGKDRFFFKSLGWAQLAAGHAAEAAQAFRSAVQGMGDWSDKTAVEPNIDGWTAAYFLDLVTQQEYTDRWRQDAAFAGFPWFYVGQRMEIEENKDAAVEAYRKSVDLAKQAGAHYIRNWSAYRLAVLTGAERARSAESASPAATNAK